MPLNHTTFTAHNVNHDRLLEASARAFGTEGADTSSKAIAADAGAGIGALYRRFPTRDDLIEATYRDQTARLCDRAPHLLTTRSAMGALETWTESFVDHLLAKHGMADALPAILARRGDLRMQSRKLIVTAIDAFLAAGIRQGTVRKNVAAGDVMMALGGITLISATEHERDLASRLIGLLLAGVSQN